MLSKEPMVLRHQCLITLIKIVSALIIQHKFILTTKYQHDDRNNCDDANLSLALSFIIALIFWHWVKFEQRNVTERERFTLEALKKFSNTRVF